MNQKGEVKTLVFLLEHQFSEQEVDVIVPVVASFTDLFSCHLTQCFSYLNSVLYTQFRHFLCNISSDLLICPVIVP